ncbi:hypothetical protein EKH55_0459 [Sinorhizobium alkalisoli]|nr:hypothetical protein EKH55_0459 [Sinorhizobium alkalisoli]
MVREGGSGHGFVRILRHVRGQVPCRRTRVKRLGRSTA